MLEAERFRQYVHEVVAHLDDPLFLRRHPLTTLLAAGGSPLTPDALRRWLLNGLALLRPPPGTPPTAPAWRRWQALSLRYGEGLSTTQIAHQLHLSDRQVRRDLQAGLDALATALWEEFVRTPPAAASPLTEPAPEPQADLECELARVEATTPAGPTDLGPILASALTTVRPMVEGQQVSLQATWPPDLPPVTVSPPVLRQIVLCLLTGLLQCRPATLDLTVQSAPPALTLTLSARPVPIPLPAEAADLLQAARRLVEAEGGSLTQTGPGPLVALTLALPTRPLLTVLLVDDNPDLAQLFRRYLAGGPYRLVQARTPPTALELARTLRPAVILLDVLLPTQDGWQVLQDLQRDPATRTIPVIVCSVLPEKPLALSLGAADFLAKPVLPQALRAALDRCTRPLAAESAPR